MYLMRQHAENMLDHQAAGMPPLLHFEGKQPLCTIERTCSDSIASALESWRHLRDKSAEGTFKSLYET